MITIPISATSPYRFNPLTDAVAVARLELEDAERKLSEAEAMPDGKARTAALLEAEVDRDMAQEALKTAESNLTLFDARGAVYLLRVPTPRTRQAFADQLAKLPLFPNDTAMLRALQAAAKDRAFSGEDTLALEALCEVARGRGNLREEALASELTRLTEAAAEHPAVAEIRAKRAKWQSAYNERVVRFHLVGWDGGDLPEFPGRDRDDLADASVMDLLPPEDFDAIAEKVAELQTLRGRMLGNSAGRPS